MLTPNKQHQVVERRGLARYDPTFKRWSAPTMVCIPPSHRFPNGRVINDAVLRQSGPGRLGRWSQLRRRPWKLPRVGSSPSIRLLASFHALPSSLATSPRSILTSTFHPLPCPAIALPPTRSPICLPPSTIALCMLRTFPCWVSVSKRPPGIRCSLSNASSEAHGKALLQGVSSPVFAPCPRLLNLLSYRIGLNIAVLCLKFRRAAFREDTRGQRDNDHAHLAVCRDYRIGEASNRQFVAHSLTGSTDRDSWFNGS